MTETSTAIITMDRKSLVQRTRDRMKHVRLNIDTLLKPKKEKPQQNRKDIRTMSKELSDIKSDLEQKTVSVRLLDYWKGLVRDSDGRWKHYEQKHPNYFIGVKSVPNLRDIDGDVRLLERNLDANQYLLSHMSELEKGMDDSQFLRFLVEMHKKRAFIPGTAGKIITAPLVSQGSHTDIVKRDVAAIAIKYNDRYQCIGEKTVSLEGISPDGLPKDRWLTDDLVYHYYPNAYYREYIPILNSTLTDIIRTFDTIKSNELIEKLAKFYQYGANVRMFDRTNQAYFNSICNIFLHMAGLKPVENGILDFVAMRLRSENFQKYYYDEVQRVNKHLPDRFKQ